MTLSQTFQLWGGVKRGIRVNDAFRAIDVTLEARNIAPGLLAGARTAAVHIGYSKFFFSSRSKNMHLRRHIVGAAKHLRALGYTHVTVTGPFVFEIQKRSRLLQVAQFQNHRALALPMQLLYQFLLSVRLAIPFGLTSTQRKRLCALRRNARDGFSSHAIFALPAKNQ